MKKTAIIYATHDGHTKKICETINEHLSAPADLLNVEECTEATIETYDVIILGSAIRYGKHLKPMIHFLTTHGETLSKKNTAFFSVNLTARKGNRNTPKTSNYLKKFLATLSWQPNELDVFAGKLDYPNYRFFDKQMIRFIMWITKGPTDLSTVQEFTDWDRVHAFAEHMNQIIK